MVNVEALVRTHLGLSSTLAALVSTRIYAGVNLPDGYSVADGPAILYTVRGGNQDYSGRFHAPSLQFRCYAATEELARTVGFALYDYLNDAKPHTALVLCRLEDGTYPTLLQEPGSLWFHTLLFFRFYVTN